MVEGLLSPWGAMIPAGTVAFNSNSSSSSSCPFFHDLSKSSINCSLIHVKRSTLFFPKAEVGLTSLPASDELAFSAETISSAMM